MLKRLIFAVSKEIELPVYNKSDMLVCRLEEVEALTEAINKLQNKADEPVLVEVVNNTEGNAELKTDEAQKEAGSNENLMQENNFFGGQNQAMQASDNVQAVSSQSVSYTNVEAENIMRQIMDHMQLQ